MKEENKYYTPEISEFHDGFSYEITSGYEWVKKEFSHEDFNSFLYQNLINAIKQNYVRVRHLDKEDIESFGFVKDSGDADFIKDKYQIEIYPAFVLHITSDYGCYLLFHGKIKNRSELKRLLTQLEIL